ncbi:SusC/RagA family TonB-linked outer membrane protein [uncultured Dokdonia sp.]|uniref:SusC/RagA family TonB-linked outer membrane protein n=1 Tax=uncultured Dokdonia sp. TaxID=575653 RepID=UPI002617C099|nr:SusC/RagA family TonB-linked outer membrane protein [uncultured Dokdonia sp.]
MKIKRLIKNSLALIFILSNIIMSAQSVSGKVTDKEGIPLPQATVQVKGSENGVASDFDGNYQINNVTQGAILVFSYIGFETQEVNYTGQNEINIRLVIDAQGLDEITIVNYGRQRNTPVSVVKSKDLTEFPTTDIGQALQGRAAGVTVTNGGGPGTQTLIQIRGTNTFGDGSPLFVVDGVFTESINSIDPENIQKIDILKDAASLAIYGSRGTNGVVLITTKKGKAGVTYFSAKVSSGFQEFNQRYDVLNTEQYIRYLRELNSVTGQPGALEFPIAVVNDNPLFDGNGIDTDWQDEYFNIGNITNISANAGGGSEKARFNVSFSHLNQEGVYIETGFERTTFNVNSDVSVNDWLDLGQTLSAAYNETVVPESDGGRDPLFNILGSAPYIPVRNADGSFAGHNTLLDVNNSRNQIRIQDSQDNLNRFGSLIASAYAKIKLFDGLTLRSQFGFDGNISIQDNFRRAFEEVGGSFSNPNNFISNITNNFSQTVWTSTLAFDKSFGKHDMNISTAFEQTKVRLESTSASDVQQVSPELTEILSPNSRSTSFNFRENLNSILFIGGYEYDKRYTLSSSARRDTSSRFDTPFASDWFFSAGLGWNVSNESFFNIEAINNFKLRASIGQTGNNRTGNDVNIFLPTLGANLPTVLDNETVIGISPNNAANPFIRWETQVKQNYGLSLGFLNNKITFTYDYFSNVSEDLIIPVNLPSSSGIPGSSQQGDAVIRNVGDVEVTGMEFSLGYNDYEGDFQYNISANLTTSESIVRSLGGSGQPIERAILNPPFDIPLNRLSEGLPAFHFFGLVADGVYSTQEQIDAELPNNSQSAVPVLPGDVRFIDLNGDGQINFEDRDVIGNPNPDFTYAISFRATYKNWDLDILANGVQGVDALNSNIFFLQAQENVLNQGTEVIRRFRFEGDITDIPRFRFGSNINNTISTRYIEDASFLRLRNVTIGYTFDQKKLNNLLNGALKKVRLYAQAQNIVTLTNYSGFDPEIAPFYNAQGLVDGLGIDRSAQPRPFTFLSGLQIEF